MESEGGIWLKMLRVSCSDDRELGVIHLRRVCSGFRRAGPSLSSVAPSEGGDSAQFWQSFIKGWSFLGFGVCVGPLRVQAPYSVGTRYRTVGIRKGEAKENSTEEEGDIVAGDFVG